MFTVMPLQTPDNSEHDIYIKSTPIYAHMNKKCLYVGNLLLDDFDVSHEGLILGKLVAGMHNGSMLLSTKALTNLRILHLKHISAYVHGD